MTTPLVIASVSRGTNEVIDSVWRQIGYIWNYKSNIHDLDKQLQRLKTERLSTLRSLDEATRNGEEIEDTITNWLINADEAIEAADTILKGNAISNHSCFNGCFPDFKTSYQLSRKANKESTPVKGLSLKELRVNWSNNVKKIYDGELVTALELFCSLKVLELKHFPSQYSVLPSNLLERSPNLEALLVSDASFEEIFSQVTTFNEEESSMREIPLRHLTLSHLPQLRHLISDDTVSVSLIQHVESLEVLECTKLTILVPPSISFQNLKILKVSKCHGLLNLITSSTVKSLAQLTRLEMTECEIVEEIVARETDEVEAEIGFSQLKHLELVCLPKLTRFSSGNKTCNFPCLEEVIVRECPNMEIFVEGELSTPNLTSVQPTEDESEWCWEGSLNATIQKLFKETVAKNVEEH